MNDCDYICELCPHCECYVWIYKNEINCNVFRHGVARSNLDTQMNPHESKEQCDLLVAREEILGCGKPFRVEPDDKSGFKLVACDYV